MAQGTGDDLVTSPVVWAGGLAGALVSALHTPGLNVWGKLSAVVVGTLAAGFITPAAAEAGGLSKGSTAAAGFFIGLVGMAVTAILVNGAAKARENPAVLVVWFRSIWRIYKGRDGGPDDPHSPPSPKPPVPPASPAP